MIPADRVDPGTMEFLELIFGRDYPARLRVPN